MKTARLDNVKDGSLWSRVRPAYITGWFGRARVFLAQVKNEMERVTWPTRKEVYATTFVVILTSIFFGMYLWGIDLVLTRIARFIFETFGVQ